MIFETKRLILRPWEESDAEECYEYAKDPRVGTPAGWPPHTSVENSRQIIKDILSARENYAVVLKETGLPIGSVGLRFHSDIAEKDDEAELGYWLGVPYWGKGIMPEAAGEMLRHAFEDLSLNRVWCAYFDGNTKSKRVQEKLGFRYRRTSEDVDVPQMGEKRRGHVNLITKEEWLSDRESHGNRKTVLLINACARPDSRTLPLAKKAAEKFSGDVHILNLFEENIVPLNYETLSMREHHISENDFSGDMFRFGKQFRSADIIVVAAPYWDLSFPSVLKCYTEAICVNGLTFKYNELGIPEGMCRAEKLVYVTTAGGFIPENDHGYSYIRQLCADFFGITDAVCIKAEGLDIYGADIERILASAASDIDRLL